MSATQETTRATAEGAAHGGHGSRTYFPALDGVRAFAVIAVMLYHGGVTRARGGFLGVDVFFVLSGFLITWLLLAEWNRKQTINRLAFWARRARRLLPAVFLVLAFVACYAAFLATREEVPRIRGDGLATLFYVQNWHAVFSGQSYFDQFRTPSPLRHTWSLAIEEQFYLIWPLLLPLLLKATRARIWRMMAVVSALASASAVLMVVLYRPHHDPSRVYYGTDTRMQAVLIGALVALLFTHFGPPERASGRAAMQLAGIVGAIVVVWACTQVGDQDPFLYQGGSTLVALGAAAATAAIVTVPGSAMSRVLQVAPLRAIGIISYGLYLWHWPIYVAMTTGHTGLHGNVLLAARVAVTGVAAIASYFLVERPIRYGSLRRWRMRSTAPVAAITVCVALVAATSTSIVSRPDPAGALFRRFIQHAADTEAAAKNLHASGAPRVLVAGDSVALTLGFSDEPLRLKILESGAAILGCGLARGDFIEQGKVNPLNASCANWPSAYRAGVERLDPDVSVVLIGAWEVFDRVVNGTVLRVGTSAWEQYLLAELGNAYRILTSHGGRILLLTAPCYGASKIAVTRTGTERTDPVRVAAVNKVLDNFTALHPQNIDLVNLQALVCPVGRFTWTIDHKTVRTDDGIHFTADGATIVWDWLAPTVRELTRERRA